MLQWYFAVKMYHICSESHHNQLISAAHLKLLNQQFHCKLRPISRWISWSASIKFTLRAVTLFSSMSRRAVTWEYLSSYQPSPLPFKSRNRFFNTCSTHHLEATKFHQHGSFSMTSIITGKFTFAKLISFDESEGSGVMVHTIALSLNCFTGDFKPKFVEICNIITNIIQSTTKLWMHIRNWSISKNPYK